MCFSVPIFCWWYLFSNLWALTPNYETAESLWAGRQTARRFVTQGLAGLHSLSDTLAQCLCHWQDCQSYLSQLCLAIRLVVPSVAFSFPCPRQMVPVQPFALNQIICSLDGCLFPPFQLQWQEGRGQHSHSVCQPNWARRNVIHCLHSERHITLNIVWKLE